MRCITFCLSLAILFCSVLSAFAQTDVHSSKVVTGPGGVPFVDACHPGDVLIGFNYIAGKAMNTFAGVCQAQNNGVLTGANYGLFTRGNIPSSGGFFDPVFHAGDAVRCPPGEAIKSMRVWLDKHAEVNSVAATCEQLRPDSHLQAVYLGQFGGAGGEAVSNEPISCGSDDIAIGIIGRASNLINGLGLDCGTFTWRQAAVVTPGSTPTPPTPHYVKVIADDVDVFSACSGNQTIIGHISTTTDQLVLRKLGDPSACPNWYDMSWPNAPAEDNWVYSAPPPGKPNDPTSLDQTTLAAAEAALGGGH